MNFLRTKLIEEFTAEFVTQKCDQIAAVATQGFDIFVCSENNTILKMVMQAFKQRSEGNNFLIGLVCEFISPSAEFMGPVVLFGQSTDVSPGGMMRFEIKRYFIEAKMVPNCINKVLDHYALTCYLDVFDRNKVTEIKRISEDIEVDKFIDMVLCPKSTTGPLNSTEGQVNSQTSPIKKLLPSERCVNACMTNFKIELFSLHTKTSKPCVTTAAI